MRKILQQGAGGLLCFAVGLACSSSTTVESSGSGKSGAAGGGSGGTAGKASGGSSNAGSGGRAGASTGGTGGGTGGAGQGGMSTGGSAGMPADASTDSSTGGTGGGGEAGVCTPGAKDCAGDVPRVCNNAGQWDSLPACPAPSSKCDAGACVPQNCTGLQSTCGANSNRSCCETAAIAQGPFPMGRSASGSDAFAGGQADEQPEHTATPLAFRLDVFEVTVGRFRRFLAGYPANRPAAGAGAHPGIVNSGWQTAWNAALSDDAYFFGIELRCSNRATWTDPAGANENRPINCISYYAAFAFCAWDGGFLPTEAEWELAAAGGSENRLYPWGSQTPDKTRTAFDCTYGATFPCDFDDIPLVGMLPTGAARYGHLDMAGNMAEWTLDAYGAGFYAGAGQTCNNCANLTGTTRVLRGGSWLSAAADLRAARRDPQDPAENDEGWGIRCARP